MYFHPLFMVRLCDTYALEWCTIHKCFYKFYKHSTYTLHPFIFCASYYNMMLMLEKCNLTPFNIENLQINYILNFQFIVMDDIPLLNVG
jgi:hypothetical protein